MPSKLAKRAPGGKWDSCPPSRESPAAGGRQHILCNRCGPPGPLIGRRNARKERHPRPTTPTRRASANGFAARRVGHGARELHGTRHAGGGEEEPKCES